MNLLFRIMPHARRREIGRREHFRRTAILAGAMAALWLFALIGFVVQAGSGGGTEDLGWGSPLWAAVPFMGMIAFDRLQASVDQACRGSEP